VEAGSVTSRIKPDYADLDTDELACVVRDELQQVRQAWSNALDHAMKAGDALIAVQPKVAERGIAWKGWLKTNCLVAVSTAELYIQLARHRDEIEAQRLRGVELSVRAARRLISDSSASDGDDHDHAGDGDDAADADNGDVGEAEHAKKPETLIDHWHRCPGELTELLDAIGVEGVLEAMSAEFGRLLRARLPAPKRKPYGKTLTLTANSREERDRHSPQ
jgi:hypothetical protein